MGEINSIKTIVIVGAGIQGHAICQVALMAGFENVILNDIKMDILKNASNLIENGMSKSVTENIGLRALEERGLLPEGKSTDDLLENLILEEDLKKAVENADYLIEAVPEVMEVKRDVYNKLGKLAPYKTTLSFV